MKVKRLKRRIARKIIRSLEREAQLEVRGKKRKQQILDPINYKRWFSN